MPGCHTWRWTNDWCNTCVESPAVALIIWGKFAPFVCHWMSSLQSCSFMRLCTADCTTATAFCKALVQYISDSFSWPRMQLHGSLLVKDSISSFNRNELHWLPVKQRIHFMQCMLVFKSLHGMASAYIAEMCVKRCFVNVTSCDLLFVTNLCYHSPRKQLSDVGVSSSTPSPRSFWSIFLESPSTWHSRLVFHLTSLWMNLKLY